MTSKPRRRFQTASHTTASAEDAFRDAPPAPEPQTYQTAHTDHTPLTPETPETPQTPHSEPAPRRADPPGRVRKTYLFSIKVEKQLRAAIDRLHHGSGGKISKADAFDAIALAGVEQLEAIERRLRAHR